MPDRCALLLELLRGISAFRELPGCCWLAFSTSVAMPNRLMAR